MTSHVIAYRSLELLFGTHTFNFNCFFEDFNCVFTQIRCLSRVLLILPYLLLQKTYCEKSMESRMSVLKRALIIFSVPIG